LADIVAKVQTIRASALRLDKDWHLIEQSLAPSDVPKVLEALKKNGSKEVQRSLTYQLLSFWAGSQPVAAIAYADGVSGKQEHEQAVLAVLNGWTEKDPQAAAAWARKLPSGQLRRDALNAVIQPLAQSNPQAAFALLRTEKPGELSWTTAFESLAEHDVAAAVAKLSELPSGQARSEALQTLLQCGAGTLRKPRSHGP
jgi:hypothetical protein